MAAGVRMAVVGTTCFEDLALDRRPVGAAADVPAVCWTAAVLTHNHDCFD